MRVRTKQSLLLLIALTVALSLLGGNAWATKAKESAAPVVDKQVRQEETSPETMEVGAALLRKGINGSAIIDGTYFEKSYVQNQMLGKALLESMMILNKKAVVSVIRLKEMEFFQAKPSDLDGIVSVLRQTRGVEVAILLYELEPQTFKVSLRSKEIVDVSAVAKYYGGGGHVRAAGVTMKGSPHDVINNLTLLIERQLRAAEEKNEEK